MINKLLVLAVLPLMSFPPPALATTSLADVKKTVHELRTVMNEKRDILKSQIGDMSDEDLQSIQEDVDFLENMTMYIKLQEVMEMNLIFLELAASKHVK